MASGNKGGKGSSSSKTRFQSAVKASQAAPF